MYKKSQSKNLVTSIPIKVTCTGKVAKRNVLCCIPYCKAHKRCLKTDIYVLLRRLKKKTNREYISYPAVKEDISL